MPFQWRDTTSRKRGEDRSAEPRTVTADVAWARISVTRHIHNPGAWHLFSPDLGITNHLTLVAGDLEDAKREAETIISKRVDGLRRAMK